MKQETSQWGKAVKKAVIDHDMTLKQLAEKIGYSNATVSQVVNGRYSNSSYKVIAEKINEVLGTEGLPERTETPSDEWCQTVKVELVKQSMRVLAGSAGCHHVPGTPKGSSGRKPQQRDIRGLATGLLSACCREITVNVDAGNGSGTNRATNPGRSRF